MLFVWDPFGKGFPTTGVMTALPRHRALFYFESL